MLFADTVKINNDRIRYNEKQEIMNSEQFWL